MRDEGRAVQEGEEHDQQGEQQGEQQEEAEAKAEAEAEAAKTKLNLPADVLTVAATALIVRALTAGYTIIWSKLINSYKSSNDLLCDEERCTLWNYLKCFSSWDGEYFLRLSLNETEYLYEQNHAFFPALPLVVGYLKRLLKGGFPNVSACSMYVLIAIIANIFLFVLSAIGLYLFVFTTSLSVRATHMGASSPEVSFKGERSENGAKSERSEKGAKGERSAKKKANYTHNAKSVKDCRRLSFMAALLFTFNIGNIHMSSFYSEGFFSCLSIWGFTFLQWSVNVNKGSSAFFELLAVVSFSVASFFRSNGILFLIPLFVHCLRTCAFCVHCAGVVSLGREPHRRTDGAQLLSHPSEGEQLLSHSSDGAQLLSHPSDGAQLLSLFSEKRVFLKFALHWGKALLEAALVVLPLLTFQAYAYYLYCVEGYDNPWREKHKKFHNFFLSFWANPLEYANGSRYTHRQDQLMIRRPWCEKTIPFIYNYIQDKYWDVKFLKFLRSPSGNVLYALPVYFMSFHAVHHFLRHPTFTGGQAPFFLFSPFLGEVLHLGVLCLYL
ncbi:mannosyltransferase, partial [Plasmodium cynomolgi strain B]